MSSHKLILLIALLAVAQMMHLNSHAASSLNISQTNFPRKVRIALQYDPDVGIKAIDYHLDYYNVRADFMRQIHNFTWTMNKIDEPRGVSYTFTSLEGRKLYCENQPKPGQYVRLGYPENIINTQFIAEPVTNQWGLAYHIKCKESPNPFVATTGQPGHYVFLENSNTSKQKLWIFRVD